MLVTKDVLTGMGVSSANADKYLGQLNEALPQGEITTPLRIAQFLAQVVLESARFAAVEENLNYSAERLQQVWPSRFTAAQAAQYAHHPEMIANRVYADRLGNGDEASGDGYRYRGRGLIQLTGKGNYSSFKDFLAKHDPDKPDVVAQPDLVAGKYAVASAVFFWTMRNLNPLADADDVAAVTKKVNGSTRGLDARAALLAKAKALLDVEVPQLDDVTDFVKASQLNLRKEPSTAAAIVGEIGSGAPVQRVPGAALVNADGYTWAQVRAVVGAEIVAGFVAAEFLDPAPTLAAVTHVVSVSTVLRMREEPSTAGTVVAQLPDGTGVEVTAGSAVTVDGFEWVEAKAVLRGVLVGGYVADDYLEPAG